MKTRILSFDGGGINGIISAVIADRLKLDGKDYDVIAGTSTGSIIASGLMCGYTGHDITELYYDHGRDIFPDFVRRAVSGRLTGGLILARYDRSHLRRILENYFGETKMANGLIATSYDTSNRSFVVADDGLIVDRVEESCSAPVYFAAKGDIIDGGVAANNPAMAAVAYAIKHGAKLRDIDIVSVGTGYSYRRLGVLRRNLGLLPWALNIHEVLMSGPVRATHYQCEAIFGARYKRYNVEYKLASGKMDDASKSNLANLVRDATGPI